MILLNKFIVSCKTYIYEGYSSYGRMEYKINQYNTHINRRTKEVWKLSYKQYHIYPNSSIIKSFHSNKITFGIADHYDQYKLKKWNWIGINDSTKSVELYLGMFCNLTDINYRIRCYETLVFIPNQK